MFRWSLQIFICAWDTRVSLKKFYNTLNSNGAKLFAIMHLGTIMHFQTYTLLGCLHTSLDADLNGSVAAMPTENPKVSGSNLE